MKIPLKEKGQAVGKPLFSRGDRPRPSPFYEGLPYHHRLLTRRRSEDRALLPVEFLRFYPQPPQARALRAFGYVVAVAVIANGIGGAFATAGNRLTHEEALSAFATATVLGYPKVAESGDEFSVCHGLRGIQPGFLHVDGIGKGKRALL